MALTLKGPLVVDLTKEKKVFFDKHLDPDDFSCSIAIHTDNEYLILKMTMEQLQRLSKEN